MPLGLHIEGPFLNPTKKGAHNPNYLRLPTLDAVADWSPATGVRLVTLAPELPGALEVIEALSSRGVLVSAGHSMATYDQAAGRLRRRRPLRHAPVQRHAQPAGTAILACPARC
jgi:N-acetylglucosamine-6-phosphate deacetylase